MRGGGLEANAECKRQVMARKNREREKPSAPDRQFSFF